MKTRITQLSWQTSDRFNIDKTNIWWQNIVVFMWLKSFYILLSLRNFTPTKYKATKFSTPEISNFCRLRESVPANTNILQGTVLDQAMYCKQIKMLESESAKNWGTNFQLFNYQGDQLVFSFESKQFFLNDTLKNHLLVKKETVYVTKICLKGQ